MLVLRHLCRRASPLASPLASSSPLARLAKSSRALATFPNHTLYQCARQPSATISRDVRLQRRSFSTALIARQIRMNNNRNPNLNQRYSFQGPFSLLWSIIPPSIKFLGAAFMFLNFMLFITMPWLFVILPPVILGVLWFRTRVASSQIGAMNQRWVGMAQQSLVYKSQGPLDIAKLNRVCINRIHAAINENERNINTVLKVDPFAMSRNGQSLTLDPTGRITQSSMMNPLSDNPFSAREEMIVFEELLLDRSISGSPKKQVIGVIDVVLIYDSAIDPFASLYAGANNEFRYRLEVRPAKSLFPETSDVIIINSPARYGDDQGEDVIERIIDVEPVDRK